MNDYIDHVIARLRKGWTTAAYARDINGGVCGFCDPKAVCWCLTGAMQREEFDRDKRLRLWYALEAITGQWKIVDYNDNAPNVEAVITLLERCKCNN